MSLAGRKPGIAWVAAVFRILWDEEEHEAAAADAETVDRPHDVRAAVATVVLLLVVTAI
jgi:hypothetical protein